MNKIIYSTEDKLLNIDRKNIEKYLLEVKKAVEKNRYRIDRNARRQDNINLFFDYVIDEAIAKLKRGSHKWGIEQWKETNTITDKS